jgi:hypothetical protein
MQLIPVATKMAILQPNIGVGQGIIPSSDMIDFVNEHIVNRFGIPQTITTDQGSQFTSGELEEYANSLGSN